MDFATHHRTHTCGALTLKQAGQQVTLCGWVSNIRDHGGVIFLDLRDQYGTTQVVLGDDSLLEGVTRETVISVSGLVRKRDEETINTKIATGQIEVAVSEICILGSVSRPLPFEVSSSQETKEEVRLKYRFLDLRNEAVHGRIIKRSQIISHLRKKMEEHGFLEVQTPILSASSPKERGIFWCPAGNIRDSFMRCLKPLRYLNSC